MRVIKCILLLFCALVLEACIYQEEWDGGVSDWSPNRRYALVVIGDRNERNAGITGDHVCVIDMEGDSDTIFLEEAKHSEIGFVEWSPDSRRLAFPSGRGLSKNINIFVLDVETRQVSQVSGSEGSSLSPHWSPDSRRLAFIWLEATFPRSKEGWVGGDAKAIYVANADGSELRELSRVESGGFGDLAWLPDGEKLLFQQDDLYLADVDTGESVNLTNGKVKGGIGLPILSPDGKHVAFNAEPVVYGASRTGDNGIYVIDVDSLKLSQIMSIDASQALDLASSAAFRLYELIRWAPNSTSFVFELNRQPPDQSNMTFIVTADGSQVAQLVGPDPSVDLSLFLWSPDSRRMLVKEYGQPTYFIIDVDSGDFVSLQVSDQIQKLKDFQWSPDGKWIAAIAGEREDRVSLINPETGEVVPVVSLSNRISDLVWLPDGERLGFFEDREGKLPVGYIVNLSGDVLRKVEVECK